MEEDSENSGTLPPEIHHAGFLIWGSIVEDLIKLNPELKVVLAGGWAKKKGMDWGHDYPAAEFYKSWESWLEKESFHWTPAAQTLLSRMPCEKARFYTRYHSSKWKRMYKRTPTSLQECSTRRHFGYDRTELGIFGYVRVPQR
jgi:hypothetical protein